MFHTPFVPAADIGRDALSPAGMYKILRKAVPSADCITGAEAIHRVEDLEPASLVLRVDGKSLDEPDYPLVREVRAGLEVRGIRGRWARAESANFWPPWGKKTGSPRGLSGESSGSAPRAT
ncbi:MAG: hypothetical protein MZU95_08780 [Desulfomicrobium escambiense]|nr:hypothetical protein [Desulfomicrobium escambiense]